MSGGVTTSVDDVLREVDDFFMKGGPVYETLHRLARRLPENDIEYAVIGGMALALHGLVRPTQDVDLLLSREGLERFHEHLIGQGYVTLFSGARKHFRDTVTGVIVEVVTSGDPGDGREKPVAFPDPASVSVSLGEISVVGLETLIELKLASGLSAEHRRLRDLGDVQLLIETLELPEDLGRQLDPSVNGEYRRLWQLAQEARRDRTKEEP